jgi:hypothetical protein
MQSRRGYGRDVNSRQAAATLAAVAASAAPAQAGTVKQGSSGMPLRLPKPAVMPQFVVDPVYGSGAGYYAQDNTVRSGEQLNRFSRHHEMFHSMDSKEFTLADRQALARIIAPKRAHTVTDDASWWGKTGLGAGAEAGLAELAADYYAMARSGRPLRTKRGGMAMSQQTGAYAMNMRPRRMREFRVFMDEYARRHLR